jgi:glucokinase
VAQPDRIVGLDVGGTQIKGGWIEASQLPSPDPRVLADRTRVIDTQLERGVEDFLDRLSGFARELGYRGALGVGVPGVFDQRTGELQRSSNMHAIEGLHLEDELRRRLGADEGQVLKVDNDANAAAFGEQWLGAGRDVADLVLFTLGTGVGGGIVLGGQVFRGPSGRGGELGHLIIRARDSCQPKEEGLRCGCGAYGCLERLASATAAQRRARALGLTDDLVELHRQAAASPGPARQVLFEVGRDLGAGILSACALLDVTTVLIGGGFGAALELLRPGIDEALAERSTAGKGIEVRSATLGPSAGWIGAARGALD